MISAMDASRRFAVTLRPYWNPDPPPFQDIILTPPKHTHSRGVQREIVGGERIAQARCHAKTLIPIAAAPRADRWSRSGSSGRS